MNIKIKASSLYSLIGNDYDRLWTALQTQFGSEEEQIFAERTPGSGYIQWELPGEGWQALSESEPLKAAMVRKLLEERKNAVAAILPNAIAKIVLTVPDDSYIWFKDSGSGEVLIRLTAWGYRYPEKIGGTGADGYVSSRDNLVEVAVKVTKGGQPCSEETVLLNGMVRQCGADGVFVIGALPAGYQFDLEVCGEKRHVVVSESNPIIAFDFPADPVVEQESDVPSPEEPTVFPNTFAEKTPDEDGENQIDLEPYPDPSIEPEELTDTDGTEEVVPDSLEIEEPEDPENPEQPVQEDERFFSTPPQWASVLIIMLIIILTVLTYFLSIDVLYS